MKTDNIDIERYMYLADFYDTIADTRSEQKGIPLVEIAAIFLDVFDEVEIESLIELLNRNYE